MDTPDDDQPSLCVEIAVGHGSWLEQLPPSPGTGTVTVSFDDVELASRDRTAVSDLGYTVVGTGAIRNTHDVAHFLVSRPTVERHPRWWRALLDLATRVYDPRFGPVQHALGDVLRVHASAARDARTASPPRLRGRTRPRPSA